MAGTTTWRIDPAHSSVEFSVKHLMFTTVRGRFKKLEGTIVVDEEHTENSSVEVEIDASSIDTGEPDRDAHLRSADFLDVETHPTIAFRSKRVEGAHAKPGDRFRVIGDLTIRDTTMEVALDATFEGVGQDPWGGERAGFSATTEIDRRDWGLRWNQALETGGVLVGNNVRIEIEAQVVKQGAAREKAA
ncbi:MAG TPA: YceI family protein [Longimicrobiales bacterium]